MFVMMILTINLLRCSQMVNFSILDSFRLQQTHEIHRQFEEHVFVLCEQERSVSIILQLFLWRSYFQKQRKSQKLKLLYYLSITSPTDPCEKIDETCVDVPEIAHIFGRLVVPWKSMLDLNYSFNKCLYFFYKTFLSVQIIFNSYMEVMPAYYKLGEIFISMDRYFSTNDLYEQKKIMNAYHPSPVNGILEVNLSIRL